MRIGFSTIYSWRPHVEHAYFLSRLVEKAGHEAYFLTCDSNLPTCYTRELRPNNLGVGHCVGCRLGGFRSYARKRVASIGDFAGEELVDADRAVGWAESSAATLGRFETDEEFASAEFAALVRKLTPTSQIAYSAARAWIERERLDAVCVFNGRMDATRAIMEAVRDAGKRCISMERTWFGDGLQLLPDETSLGLKTVHRIIGEFRPKPLTRNQALKAARHIASRFLRINTTESRTYNVGAVVQQWPATSDDALRLLFLPGSRNEVLSHPDWDDYWGDKTRAFDALFDRIGGRKISAILRCHPNWGEKMGSRDGSSSEKHFVRWAKRRGIHVIASRETTSTLGLIEQCDAIVVAGGSAALEAGILGKQVIAASPANYEHAGFQDRFFNPTDGDTLIVGDPADPVCRRQLARERARLTLRFAYSMVYRIPQYVNEVRCTTTTLYQYAEDTSPDRLMKLIETGILEPDDARFAGETSEEDKILDLIADRRWQEIIDRADHSKADEVVRNRLSRRVPYQVIDTLRDCLPRGDFWS